MIELIYYDPMILKARRGTGGGSGVWIGFF